MWFISLILSVETSPGSNAASIKANAFIVTHIKRTVLFSEVSEVTIIKEAKCYLWWTTKDFILETLFCQCILQTQFIILIKSLLAPTVAFLSLFFFYSDFFLILQISSHSLFPLTLSININLWSKLTAAICYFLKAKKIITNQVSTRTQVCWLYVHSLNPSNC